MAKRLPKEIPAENKVEVSVLKRRKSIEDHHKKSVHNAAKAKAVRHTRKIWRAPPATIGTKRQRLRSPKEFYVNSARRENIERKMNMRRKHIDEADIKTPTTGEAIFVVLMRNALDLPKLGRELIAKYRMDKMYDSVVLAGSPDVARDMHILGDFVSVQRMDNDELFDTIRQKGRYRFNASELRPLNNNAEIEKHLGHTGVICVEDIIDVIKKGASCPIFEEVTRFLEPISLAPPKLEARRQKESKFVKAAAASAKSVAAHLDKKHKVT